jgi:hypothetical protein
MTQPKHPRPMIVLEHSASELDLSRMSDEKHAEADALQAEIDAEIAEASRVHALAVKATVERAYRIAQLRADGNRLAQEATALYLNRMRTANGDKPR